MGSGDDENDDWIGRGGTEAAFSAALHRLEIKASDQFSADIAPELRAALPDAPPTLVATLYGPKAPRHAYLVVDGTLRARVAGLFDLDVVDAPVRSLFDGEAAERSGEAGPWLVDLSISDSATPGKMDLLRDLFTRHWPAGLSILISTELSFDALRRHLRRFTKLPVRDDGRILTFRFWDPRVLAPFFDAIEGDPSRLRRMLMADKGEAIGYLLPPVAADLAQGGAYLARHVTPAPSLRAEALRPMWLQYADFSAIARARAAARRARMADRLRADFAAELADRSDDDIRATVDAAVSHFQAFGFREHAHLHLFAAWSLFYGPAFERRDKTGKLDEILRSDASEAARFKLFRRRLESIAQPESA